MFAPVLHPAMKVSSTISATLFLLYITSSHSLVHGIMLKVVAPVRKSMGVRTAFNIVGPLLNPAGAQHVVIGVFHEVSILWFGC